MNNIDKIYKNVFNYDYNLMSVKDLKKLKQDFNIISKNINYILDNSTDPKIEAENLLNRLFYLNSKISNEHKINLRNINDYLQENYKNLFNYENLQLNKKCRNRFPLINDEIILYYDFEQTRNENNISEHNVWFCFTSEEFSNILLSGINPYTGKSINYEFLITPEHYYHLNSNNLDDVKLFNYIHKLRLKNKEFNEELDDTKCDQYIEISDEANDWCAIWASSYTYGEVYITIPLNIRLEFAQTRPCKPIKLYRGLIIINDQQLDEYDLQFNRLTKDDFEKINNCDGNIYDSIHTDSESEDEKTCVTCNVVCKTFTSWTYNMSTTQTFGNYYLEAIIDPKDILVDFKNIANLSRGRNFGETEVILLPGVYKSKIFNWNKN